MDGNSNHHLSYRHIDGMVQIFRSYRTAHILNISQRVRYGFLLCAKYNATKISVHNVCTKSLKFSDELKMMNQFIHL